MFSSSPQSDTKRSASLWQPTSAGSFSLVVLGAALWGTDPLFRQWLALQLPASVIVLVEQLLPAVLVAPFIVSGLRKVRQSFSPGDWVSIVVLGCGASALATLLFTQAFTYGVPTTPVLLQQIQPLFAVVGARLVLREKLQHKFWAYLLGGLAGAYLIAFPQPNDVSVRGWMPALLAVGAAGLWGTGTVLGRRLGAKLSFAELTGLRLFFGLIAASVVVIVEATDITSSTSEASPPRRSWPSLSCLDSSRSFTTTVAFEGRQPRLRRSVNWRSR